MCDPLPSNKLIWLGKGSSQHLHFVYTCMIQALYNHMYTFLSIYLSPSLPPFHTPMQLTDISMTQDMEPTKRNIIIYDMQTGTKFILRAQNMSIRNSWLEKSNQLIRKAKMEAAKTLTVRTPPIEIRRKHTRPRSASAVARTMSPITIEEVRKFS